MSARPSPRDHVSRPATLKMPERYRGFPCGVMIIAKAGLSGRSLWAFILGPRIRDLYLNVSSRMENCWGDPRPASGAGVLEASCYPLFLSSRLSVGPVALYPKNSASVADFSATSWTAPNGAVGRGHAFESRADKSKPCLWRNLFGRCQRLSTKAKPFMPSIGQACLAGMTLRSVGRGHSKKGYRFPSPASRPTTHPSSATATRSRITQATPSYVRCAEAPL
jgi:hypothetical protein